MKAPKTPGGQPGIRTTHGEKPVPQGSARLHAGYRSGREPFVEKKRNRSGILLSKAGRLSTDGRSATSHPFAAVCAFETAVENFTGQTR